LIKNPKLNFWVSTGHIYLKIKCAPKGHNLQLSDEPKNAKDGAETIKI
jgi:hypothetical protein